MNPTKDLNQFWPSEPFEINFYEISFISGNNSKNHWLIEAHYRNQGQHRTDISNQLALRDAGKAANIVYQGCPIVQLGGTNKIEILESLKSKDGFWQNENRSLFKGSSN